MFLGTFCHSVDEKGRIAIPSRFREALNDLQGNTDIVLTRAYKPADRWLDVIPVCEWRDIQVRLKQKGIFGEKVKRFKRRYVHPAHRLSLDGQGRIVIPADLRAEIGLDPATAKEAVFTGDSEKFLLWSKAEHERTLEADRAADVEAGDEPDEFDDLDL